MNKSAKRRRIVPFVLRSKELADDILSFIGLSEDDIIPEGEQEVEDVDLNGLEMFLDYHDRFNDVSLFGEGISRALYWVARRGRLGAARTLLQYHPKLEFKDQVQEFQRDRCALSAAVQGNHPLMVKLLVEDGADINGSSPVLGTRALDEAMEDSNRLPCLRMLLQLGADVNGLNNAGRTALMHAVDEFHPADSNNLENIRLLLEAGASVHTQPREGGYAMGWVLAALTDAVNDAYEEQDAESLAATGRYYTAVLHMLLDHGAQPSRDRCPRRRREEEAGKCAVSLSEACVEDFDLLFPLCVSVLTRGVPLNILCSCHRGSPELQREPCQSGMEVLMGKLYVKLGRNPDMTSPEKQELMDKALALMDISEACSVTPSFEEGLYDDPPEGLYEGSPPYARFEKVEWSPTHPVTQLRERLQEQKQQGEPLPLRKLCRRALRRLLGPPPLESKVALLPLPPLLQDFLVPEVIYLRRPGWDRVQLRPEILAESQSEV